VLSIYAFASLKLLPAVQQIYVNLSQVKGNLSAFDAIKIDLNNALVREEIETIEGKGDARETLKIKRCLNVNNVSFEYAKDQAVLRDVTLEISVNQTIGIVGPSGSGKSTLIDVLLGLIDPYEGSISVDGYPIGLNKKRAWQNSIGFVPQTVFLTEANILENIAFGLPNEKIDLKRVGLAIELAHLSDLIARLPNGLYTKVGERGVQLSGGQRQRIAIARALYFDVDIIVFDEATSALDGESEKMIMDAIHDFHGSKTIIMIAHRLKTVERCDAIFLLENGAITDSGSYSDLLIRNEKFRNMSQLA
jgi:HlyD family secretion protein